MKKKLVLVFIFMFVVELFGIQEKASASSPRVIDVEAGFYHTIALKDDGTVWAWGLNEFGQLGDGTYTNRNYPVQVGGLSGIKAVDAGDFYNIALKDDGTVWLWGYNEGGQLGDGTSIRRVTPVQAIGLSGIIDISGGEDGTIALKNDGTVWFWGTRKTDGSQHPTPYQIPDFGNVTSIKAGNNHYLALKSDGTLWAWGCNPDGELGDGTTIDRFSPVYIMSGVSKIGTGPCQSYAIKNDGTVWSWGYNGTGVLGDGTLGNSKLSPVQMIGATDVKYITGGHYHTIVLKNDGTVWGCGYDRYGELGEGIICNGNNSNVKTTLIQLSGISGAKTVAAGVDEFTVVSLQDGSVWGCGLNNYGQLGN
ncbi:RCC1 domain-containing protein [Anaerocolumna xylanovorans]|uniref:Alpha-tubulin suppressor n=1 Tax=Anaerocolumna xylanovorans DSM 12503 TaxID=1121345 RepID=A0A1M7YHQ8_9FIRM|nr:hypothetical protein [Anaerocolumna xylanovorans]SHO52048.1 Alpha-tubulin suppressor [Anaerocolumna xylanovorans DSM 12503]